MSVPLQSPVGPMGQFLYSVYVHSGPGYRGYKEDSLFYGREVPDRVQVGLPLLSSTSSVQGFDLLHAQAGMHHHRVCLARSCEEGILIGPMHWQARALCDHLLPLRTLHDLACDCHMLSAGEVGGALDGGGAEGAD